ncbi:MAG: hypothetical protein WHS46_09580 [Desulfosoma sp.]
MSKENLAMLLKIAFQLLPITLVVPYFFAGATDGKKPAQRFYLGKRFLKFLDQLFPLLLQAFQEGDVRDETLNSR